MKITDYFDTFTTFTGKAATMVAADKEHCGGTFHKGTCYIFDEAEQKLVLNKVKYKIKAGLWPFLKRISITVRVGLR